MGAKIFPQCRIRIIFCRQINRRWQVAFEFVAATQIAFAPSRRAVDIYRLTGIDKGQSGLRIGVSRITILGKRCNQIGSPE